MENPDMSALVRSPNEKLTNDISLVSRSDEIKHVRKACMRNGYMPIHAGICKVQSIIENRLILSLIKPENFRLYLLYINTYL